MTKLKSMSSPVSPERVASILTESTQIQKIECLIRRQFYRYPELTSNLILITFLMPLAFHYSASLESNPVP